MSPHRVAAPRVEDGPAPLPKGPALKCPACGLQRIAKTVVMYQGLTPVDVVIGRNESSPLPMPRACSPAHRIKLGWFRRCAEPGEHLHEHCHTCGLEWLTAFAGEGQQQ